MSNQTKIGHGSMTNSQLLEIMAQSIEAKLTHKMLDLGMTLGDAINATREETCAGPKAWDLALNRIKSYGAAA